MLKEVNSLPQNTDVVERDTHMDKRTQSDVEHAFIEFVDKVTELGFKFDFMAKLELIYIKGDAADSPHSMANKITLRAEDFIKLEEKKILVEDSDDPLFPKP